MNLKKTYIAFILVIFLVLVTACKSSNQNQPVTETTFLLDTLNKITAYGPNASEAINEAFDRVAEIENKMTSHSNESEVVRINKASGHESVMISPDTFYVIEKGLDYSEKTKGRFDITIGPLVQLWGIGTENERVPSKIEIIEALELVDYKELILDPDKKSVKLKRPNMAIDLGAIAKGYAADEAARILRNKGIKNAVIDLGGNIFALGKKPDGNPWRVGIQDPSDNRGKSFATVEVSDKTLVTSGPYERFFEKNGKRYHHILDPDNGYPVQNGLISTTIITSKSIDADSLSTAVFAMGLKEGMKFIENLEGVDAILVTENFDVYTSSGVHQYNFQLIDDKYRLINQP